MSPLMGPVTSIFDLLTLKLVCESHQRWRTFIPSLDTLGLRILQLFAMYATDGQKQTLLPPSCGRGHNNISLFTKYASGFVAVGFGGGVAVQQS